MLICPFCNAENPDGKKFCNDCGASLSGNSQTGQLNPDTILEGRYIIVKTLGRGGMGAVYLALDQRLNHTTVAIKEMSTNAVGTGNLQTAISAFKKEASMLIGMHHPALPVVRDFFPEGQDRWYLVMDYIQGETLQQIVERRGKIPEAEVVDWARQIGEILSYLHEQNPPIIFRDLKPSNIMLTSHGQIKLIDFGIARHFQPGNSADTSAYGSHGFAPPEQYGTNQTDARSDIYALGANMHYLLTGINPINNPFVFELPGKTSKVSRQTEAAIMKALALKADDRHGNVREMLDLLPNGTGRTNKQNKTVAARTTAKQQKINTDQNAATVPISGEQMADNYFKPEIINSQSNASPNKKPGKKTVFILVACFLLLMCGAYYTFRYIQTGSHGLTISKSITAKAKQKLDMAVKYLSEQKYEQAILAYKEAIKIDRKNATAYKGLSLAYTLQGKPAEAEKALQDGLAVLADNEELQLAMAGLMLDQGKNGQAENIYKKLTGKNKPSLSACQAYIDYLSKAGKEGEAIALLIALTGKNPQAYQLETILAELYIKSGDREKAQAAINASLDGEFNQSAAYKQLNTLYKDRWDELIALAEQYLQQGQTKTGVIYKLSGLYGMNRFEELIKEYENLSTDMKDNPRIKLLAAQAFTQLGKQDQSTELLKAIKLADLKDAGMLADLANFYLAVGDKEKMRSIAMQGINLDESLIDNYLLMYKATANKEWLYRYVLGSMNSNRQAMNLWDSLVIKKDQPKTSESSTGVIRITEGINVNAVYLGTNRGFKITVDPNLVNRKIPQEKLKYWAFDFSPVSRTASDKSLRSLLKSGVRQGELGTDVIEKEIFTNAGSYYVQVIFLNESNKAVGYYETLGPLDLK
ncbi:MAG: protein kinase domain-containing protein [Methanobacterium sp.]